MSVLLGLWGGGRRFQGISCKHDLGICLALMYKPSMFILVTSGMSCRRCFIGWDLCFLVVLAAYAVFFSNFGGSSGRSGSGLDMIGGHVTVVILVGLGWHDLSGGVTVVI